MKTYNKIIGLFICAALIFGVTACNNSQKSSKVSQEAPSYSNLESKNSVEEVKTLLSAYLDKDSVDKRI